MRRHDPGDRIISNEVRATWVDGVQGTSVIDGCDVTISATNDLTISSGTVAASGDIVDVSGSTETVTALDTDEYRYVTVSVQPSGDVEVTQGNVGTLDASGNVDTEVGEPPYPLGNVYLATAIQFDDGLNTVFDGRFIVTTWVGDEITTNSITSDSYNDDAIDHDQTSNRTHSGDSLTPASVDSNTVSTADAITNNGGDYNEAIETHATASGAVTVDLADGNHHRIEAIDNIDITITGVTTTPPGNSVTIHVVDDDGAGPYTITWNDTELVWSDGNVVDEVEQTENVEVGIVIDANANEWRARQSGVSFA